MSRSPGDPLARPRPAVAGGAPVRERLLPYGRHQIRPEDVEAVLSALRSGWLTGGPALDAFEADLARRVGVAHAVGFSSGTAALHAAVAAAGLGPGDEAVTSPLTFCATANCLLYQGATPVFADVRADTLTLDPVEVQARLSPRTKAILPVDYAGHPADLVELRRLADRYDLVLIEDACHALGATVDGRPVGGLAHLTVFSFHPVKHVAAGEGGAVTTDDAGLAERLRRFRNHGLDRDPRAREAAGDWVYDVDELGFNYRLGELGAALGRSQLARLDDNLARRRQLADRYNRELSDCPGLDTPFVGAGVEPAWHIYSIRLRLGDLRADRGMVYRALRAEGIGVNVHYIPVTWLSLYRRRFGFRGGECPRVEAAYHRLLTLPLFPDMSDADAADVITAVRRVLEYYAR